MQLCGKCASTSLFHCQAESSYSYGLLNSQLFHIENNLSIDPKMYTFLCEVISVQGGLYHPVYIEHFPSPRKHWRACAVFQWTRLVSAGFLSRPAANRKEWLPRIFFLSFILFTVWPNRLCAQSTLTECYGGFLLPRTVLAAQILSVTSLRNRIWRKRDGWIFSTED